MDHILQYLREKQQSVYQHAGIAVTKVASEDEGIALSLPLLNDIVSKQTVLYLSGGRTPKNLYTQLAKEEAIAPGAFAMVDERYGRPMHKDSNEKMLFEAGLLRYAQMLGIPFHKVLRGDRRDETADSYDDTVRSLLAQYQKHFAILGVGMDGHTAGIPADASLGLKGEAKEMFLSDMKERSRNRMVMEYDDTDGFYKERITMTYEGLLMMDVFLVLVFGEDKKRALSLMFSDGSEDDIPSRFLKRPDIAKKTLLITDQQM